MIQKIEDRRETKISVSDSRTRVTQVKAHERCMEANGSAKRSVIADKRNSFEALAPEVKEAAYQNRTKDQFFTTKR
ncbi:hypothetical protein DPMN_130604 [Dreissena polymorpha]|uniref:Uncharacterized protein n=1 Tax=Dreissena polymorpha TaxID=45954 RepID=A0A9D4K1F1_DREPO|nr:hypothetical protein DPMN_130604 [Dreissena polymorpha]